MSNKLVIASAGAGKTRLLVNQALSEPEKQILITTFTEASEADIKEKIVDKRGAIPKNITVQTWFSFLLEHGVKPYQGGVYDKRIKGMILVNGKSGVKCFNKYGPVYFSEKKEFERYYFSKEGQIFSDKLAKLVLRCNEYHEGLILQRLERCFDVIMVDEVQDLAGFDLEILKLLFESNIDTLLVGDPRQGTYSTANTAKNKKYAKSQIVSFFHTKHEGLVIDEGSLVTNYRCIEPICSLSNALFPEMAPSKSGNEKITKHDGIFLVTPDKVEQYIEEYSPMILRDSTRTTVPENFDVLNFGVSKGLAFNRVLIYPTKPIVKWLADHDCEFAPTSRSKFYVALTRAKQSVAIVCEYSEKLSAQYSYY